MGYAVRVLREVCEEPYRARTADPTDPDLLDDLGDEIATLAAHIHAATQRFLELIARFDRLRGWERSGHRGCAEWLAARTGLDLGTAREKVRAARVLAGLPLTSAAMGRGELSFSQVRALTRVATAENEADLLDLARGATTAQLERMVRGWRAGSRRDEAERERAQHAARTFSVFPDDDGMYVVRGRLTAEVAAVLMKAVDAAADALFRKERSAPDADSHPLLARPGTDDPHREAAQRRADALGLLAERALAAGFAGDDVPVSGSRAERYQVTLHVEPATLSAVHEPGRSELEDGVRVSAETSRRLACDAAIVRVLHGDGATGGPVLDVGRRTRTVSAALRRALEARDRGCRFPRCGLRFTDAHHVKHWAEGGGTSLDNCLLLCRHHHRLVHEGGWSVGWWGAGHAVFYDPRGGVHYDGGWGPPPLSERPLEALLRENRLRGVLPDELTAGARWEREGDIPDAVYLRACGAV